MPSNVQSIENVSGPLRKQQLHTKGGLKLYHAIPRIFMMLVSPALVLWSDLKHRNTEVKKWSLVFFVTFLGSVITIQPGFRGADGARHWLNAYTVYSWMDFGEFVEGLLGILTFNPPSYARGDVYIHVLSYFLGNFLGLPCLFFVVVAFVYGYFFSSSIFSVFAYLPKSRLPFLLYGFATVFIFWKNVEGYQTVRTWTGLWVLFYGSLRYFETKKKKYLFIMALPPLFHFGFFIMAVPAWIVVLFKVPKRYKTYAVIFFISFFFSASHDFIARYLSVNPLGENRVSAYSVEDVDEFYSIENYRENTWYVQLQRLGVQNWARDVLIFTLILTGIYFYRMNFLERSLFSVGILTVALSNMAVLVYALHNRSSQVGGLFVLGAFVLFLIRICREQKKFSFNRVQLLAFWSSFVLLIPFLIYKAAVLILYVSLFVFVFPPIPWFWPDLNISVREFLGLILGR